MWHCLFVVAEEEEEEEVCGTGKQDLVYEVGDMIRTSYPPYGKIPALLTGMGHDERFIVMFMDGKVSCYM